eukprot:1006298-Prorocentrum_lima.AAC.1
MTSSLVGSEMCIRDSCSGMPIGANAGPSKTSFSTLASEASLWQPPTAVSYTHLTLPTICSV